MSINDCLTASFKGASYQPQIIGNSAVFNYPCSDSTSCSPFTVFLSRGRYKFELWGAQGGDARIVNEEPIRQDSGGKGAYVAGIISLIIPRYFHLYVGGKGEDQSSTAYNVYSRGGFNGGGQGGIELHEENGPPESSAGGGGASDIRLLLGDSLEHLQSRIIVAAGGGGATSCDHINQIGGDYRGGHGGKLQGIGYNNVTIPGKQNQGSFGKGVDGHSIDVIGNINGGSSGGGGSGYYGGNQLSLDEITQMNPYFLEVGGAGGSSFVSGYAGCDAVFGVPLDEIKHTNQPLHYSKLFFTSISMHSGDETFNKPLSSDTEKGHSGNGTIVITFISSIENPFQVHRCSLNFVHFVFTLINFKSN